MSYLMLTEGEIEPFKKAVISFWFRVPQETVDKVYEEAKDHFAEAEAVGDAGGFLPPPPFIGVIPLVVFGKGETQKGLGAELVPSGEIMFHVKVFILGVECDWHDLGDTAAPTSLFQFKHEPKYDYPIAPSYIGVDCKPTLDDDGHPTGPPKVRLALNLQMQDRGEYKGSGWVSEVSSSSSSDRTHWQTDPNASDSICAGSGPPPYSFATTSVTVKGVPELVYGGRPENFRLVPERPTEKSIEEEGGKEIKPDQWHHVIISFDLGDKALKTTGFFAEAPSTPPLPEGETEYHGSVGGAAKLWIALDDKNLTKKELSVYWPKGGGDNDFISVNGYQMYTDVSIQTPPATFIDGGYEAITHSSTGYEQASYSYEASDVLAKPFGIPAYDEFVDNVRLCQMAEFMLFTGVTLDTSKEDNRRLFIKEVNKYGKQRPTNFSPIAMPYYKYAVSEPDIWEPGADWPAFAPSVWAFDPSAIPTYIKAFGKDHQTADIDLTKCGINWQMGRNLGTVDGKFEKTGKIKIYSPDPFIEGGGG